MLDPILLRTADRNLRRKFSADIAGLIVYADALASNEKATPVTITNSGVEGATASGQITMPAYVWLAAAENLLGDQSFNVNAVKSNAPRMIMPDYTNASPV
jgi:hypothetical protein